MRLIKRNPYAAPNPKDVDLRKATSDLIDLYPGDDFIRVVNNYKGDVDIRLHGPGNLFHEDYRMVTTGTKRYLSHLSPGYTYTPANPTLTVSGQYSRRVRISGFNRPVINKKLVITQTDPLTPPADEKRDPLQNVVVEDVDFLVSGESPVISIACPGVVIRNCRFICESPIVNGITLIKVEKPGVFVQGCTTLGVERTKVGIKLWHLSGGPDYGVHVAVTDDDPRPVVVSDCLLECDTASVYVTAGRVVTSNCAGTIKRSF